MNRKLWLRAAGAWAAILLAGLSSRPASSGLSSGGSFAIDSASNLPGGRTLAGGNFLSKSVVGQPILPPHGHSDRVGGGRFDLRLGFLNPPRLSLQSVALSRITDPSGKLALSLTSFSVPLTSFEVGFSQDPVNRPMRVDPVKILQANSKVEVNGGPMAQVIPDAIMEVNITDGMNYYDGPIVPPGTMTFSYRDSADSGVVDGTNPPVRASTLNLWYLDENTNSWVKVPDARLDEVNHAVSAPLKHLSVYALIGSADTNVSDVFAFPVPFRPNGPNAGTGAGQTGTEAAGITFRNLPTEGAIEVYTLSGQRVRRLDIPQGLFPAQLRWDVRNDAGASVASGVYIWRIMSGSNKKSGRLMVIR